MNVHNLQTHKNVLYRNLYVHMNVFAITGKVVTTHLPANVWISKLGTTDVMCLPRQLLLSQ